MTWPLPPSPFAQLLQVVGWLSTLLLLLDGVGDPNC